MKKERRQFRRVMLNIPTSLKIYHIQGYQAGVVTNLSCDGCFLQIGDILPLGERCELVLTLGEALETEELELKGTIIRSSLEGVGIRFSDCSHKRKDLLKIMKVLGQSETLK